MNTDDYLNALTDQIRYKMARSTVAEEIRIHIEDQTETFLHEGMDEENAEKMAVQEMGDPIETGIALDRIHRPRMAWGMIGLVALLSITGLILQYLVQLDFSKAQMSGIQTAADRISYLFPVDIQKSIFIVILGLAMMVFVCYADYSRIGLWAKEIMIFLFLGILVWKQLAGNTINGAQNWVNFGPVSINISMLLFLFVPLYGAALYSYRGKGYRGMIYGLIWMFPPVWIALGIPNILTAMLLFITFMVVLTIAVLRGWFQAARKRTVGIMWFIVLMLPICMYFLVNARAAVYQVERIQMYFNYLSRLFGAANTDSGSSPYYLLEAVHQMVMKSQLVGGGQMSDGAASVMQLSNYYMLAYTLSFYGILAAAVLFSAVIFVFCRFLRISLRQKNQLGMIMGTACSTLFILQLILYFINNLGIMPTETHIPFLSYSGTGAIITYILIGILLSICRYQNILPVSPPSKALGIRGKVRV